MIRYKNTKVKVQSPDGDTDYFDNVAGVLQGDTLASYQFIICLDNVLQTIDWMKENGFTLAKAWSRRYPTQTITEVDYVDDIALQANTLAQVESLRNSQKWAAGGRQNRIHML